MEHTTQQEIEDNEMLPIVNADGDIIGAEQRRICHSPLRPLHPVVHLHLIDDNGNLYLQQRSTKKLLLPGYWDSAVGGHISLGENIELALRRETLEELGIKDFEYLPIGKYVWECQRERELVYSFVSYKYSKIIIDNDEVQCGRFWTSNEIDQALNKNILTPNFEYEYKTLLRKTILKDK